MFKQSWQAGEMATDWISVQLSKYVLIIKQNYKSIAGEATTGQHGDLSLPIDRSIDLSIDCFVDSSGQSATRESFVAD